MSEYKTKTKDELVKTLLDLKKEQMELRFQLSSGQLENASQIRKARRNVARVATALNVIASGGAKPAKETKKPAAKKAPAKKTKAA